MRRFKEKAGFGLLGFSFLFSLGALFSLLIFIAEGGAKVLSLRFLLDIPREAMTEGGIAPMIVGTALLTLGAIFFSVPLGVGAAFYLTEYAKEGPLTRAIRTVVNTLAGVPSVVYGLFGLAIFVKVFGFGVSLLSGALTLGLMALPIVISASEEALKAVPQEFREASYALGATRFQTVARTVFRTALPGIATGIILSVGRVAGETAPILFTAAAFYITHSFPSSPLDEVQALPFHIYALMAEGTYPEKQVPIAYGTALVLLMLVLLVNFGTIIMRARMRRRMG